MCDGQLSLVRVCSTDSCTGYSADESEGCMQCSEQHCAQIGCLRGLCHATGRTPSVAVPDLGTSGFYLITHDLPVGLQFDINAMETGRCTCVGHFGCDVGEHTKVWSSIHWPTTPKTANDGVHTCLSTPESLLEKACPHTPAVSGLGLCPAGVPPSPPPCCALLCCRGQPAACSC